MTQTINLGDLKIHQANCKPRKLNSYSFCGKGMELNLFHATGHFLYSLKASENWFSDVFRGYRKRLVAWNGIKRSGAGNVKKGFKVW